MWVTPGGSGTLSFKVTVLVLNLCHLWIVLESFSTETGGNFNEASNVIDTSAR